MTLTKQVLPSKHDSVLAADLNLNPTLPICIHSLGELRTPRDRLVLFGREGLLIPDPAQNIESLNQRIAQSFISHQNKKLIGINPQSKELYTSMLEMEAGKTLRQLCAIRTPLKIEVGSLTYYAGTFEGNSALIDLLGRRSVEEATGIVTCASLSSAPNTYFRCVEMHALRENNEITGVKIIGHNEHASSNHGSDREISASRHYSVAEWALSQKEQWWRNSVERLPIQSRELYGVSKAIMSHSEQNLSYARFIGELYHINRELEFLMNNPSVNRLPTEFDREVQRAHQGLRILNDRPEILNVQLEKELSLALAKMFVYDVPADSIERRHVLGESSPNACESFVRDSIVRTITQIEALTFRHKDMSSPECAGTSRVYNQYNSPLSKT